MRVVSGWLVLVQIHGCMLLFATSEVIACWLCTSLATRSDYVCGPRRVLCHEGLIGNRNDYKCLHGELSLATRCESSGRERFCLSSAVVYV